MRSDKMRGTFRVFRAAGILSLAWPFEVAANPALNRTACPRPGTTMSAPYRITCPNYPKTTGCSFLSAPMALFTIAWETI